MPVATDTNTSREYPHHLVISAALGRDTCTAGSNTPAARNFH